MKKLLLGFMALTMMLIIALVVAPSFIDWTNYRNGIAAEIERVMNRRVVIDGAVDAALLPTPRLSMRKARLGNLPGASSPTMAEAEALEVRVAFWPLLSGRVVVTSVVLRKPVIELEVLPDGRRNWLFTGSSSSTIRLRPDPPEETPDDVRFENATVDDGTIIYRDGRSGVEKRVEGVNARFAAEGLYGPLRAAGELRYGGLPLRFSLSTGRFDPRGLTATPVNLAVEIPADRRSEPARGGGNFTGTFRLPDTGPRFNGQLKLRAEDLTSFAAALGAGDDTPFVLAQPFNLEGELELKDGMLNGNDLSVRLGETRAQGAVSAWMSGDEPQFDVALSIGRIDFDAWLAAAAKKRRAQEDSGAVHEAKEFILPLGVHVTLDAAADALTYRGGAMRQVKLAAEMADGVIDIHQLSMQLPGSTDGLFTGKLLAADGRPRVDGFAELSSNDFRNLLAWLDLDAADLPAGRLNTVSATSHLAVTGEMLELGDLDLQFDNTRVKGAMVAALRDRPAFGMNLIVDQLDLDSYLSGGAPVSPEGAAVATSQAAAAIPLEALTQFDANLRLQVGRLVVGAVPARNINLDGTLANGTLTMRKLTIGDLAGGKAALSGALAGFDDKLKMNLQFDVEASEPMALLRAAGAPLPVPESALAPLSATGKLVGDSARYKIDGVVNAAAMSLTMVGDVTHLAQGRARYALDLNFDHPNYVGFLRLFDPEFAPEREAQARVISLNTKLESDGKGYKLSPISGVFGPLTLDGHATLVFDGGSPRIDAQLAAGDIDTRHFLPAPEKRRAGKAGAASVERWSTDAMGLDFARLVNGSFTISGKSLRHGTWTLGAPTSEIVIGGGVEVKQLAGQLSGGQFAAHGRLMPSGRSDAALALDYAVNLRGATIGPSLFGAGNIDLAGGRLDLSLDGAAVGTSEAALLAAMSGRGSFAVSGTQLKGFDLARINSRLANVQSPGALVRLIQSSMSSGSTHVDELRGDFTITDGVVGVDDMIIRSPAGEASVLVAADLPRWRLDATADIKLAANPAGPSFEMQLSGPLDAPKRDFSSDALQAFILEESVRRAPTSRPSPATQSPATQSAPTQRQPAPQPQQPRPPELDIAPSSQSAHPQAVPVYNVPRLPSPPQSVPADSIPSGMDSTSLTPPEARPRVLNVSPNAPGAANTPRVLNVSPNASDTSPPPNALRVLSVSPNAPGAAAPPPAPAGDGSSPQNTPKVLSVSPNAAPNISEPAEQPTSGSPDPEAFAREILRDLPPQ